MLKQLGAKASKAIPANLKEGDGAEDLLPDGEEGAVLLPGAGQADAAEVGAVNETEQERVS
ncbi:MAG: hypothetical protein WD942_10525 [Dehalococcoidia bacterium]